MIAWALDALIGGLLISPLLLLRPTQGVGAVLGFAAVVEFVALAYLIGLDGGQRGATPGKRVIGIRVSDRDGHAPIGYRSAVPRRLGYIVGYLVRLLGWLWIFVDHRHRAWHDILAGTLVVRTR